MKVRMDPISIIIVSLLIGWGFNHVTAKSDRQVCQVEEVHNGQKVMVPHYCDEVIK